MRRSRRCQVHISQCAVSSSMSHLDEIADGVPEVAVPLRPPPIKVRKGADLQEPD